MSDCILQRPCPPKRFNVNYRGSYRHLLRNSKSALLAAIEIYNKPRIEYRDECFVILMLNAWGLILKAMLSKHGASIFYRKKRREPYKTLSLDDALTKAEKFFPKSVEALPVRRNIDLLSTFRDNAVHFYNQRGFGTLIYALAQTSIVNFRDLLSATFKHSLSDEINWSLLPLGLAPPIDPITYISGKTSAGAHNSAVRQFLQELKFSADEVKKAGMDTGRLLTIFNVKLESTKKIEKADILVGVAGATTVEGPLTVVKTVDPNISHPLRQKDIVTKVETVHGRPFTRYVFDALAWKYDLKTKLQYCWKATEGVLTRYSHDTVEWIKRLTKEDVEKAISDYRAYHHSKRTSAHT